MRQRRVLVPDATNRPALTVIRSLGRQGCELFAGSPTTWSLGSASRYASAVVIHPNPSSDPRGFVEALVEPLVLHDIGVIMPAADVTASALLEYRGLLPPSVQLVLPPERSLALAHDKIELTELACKLEVPVPEGFVARGSPIGDPRLTELGYPLVLKPRVSRYFDGRRWRGAKVRIAQDAEQLVKLAEEEHALATSDYLVQRKVPGEGRGVFLLAREGVIRCVFAHRRVREKPPWGGVSTLCEAADPEPVLVDYSERLMRALSWSGVAMVEFKWDPESRSAWLMEINGRFWGSMQLAVTSGIDFPWLLYQQAVLGIDTGSLDRKGEVRLWWLLGDLDHFLIRLTRQGISTFPAMLGDLARTRQHHRLDLDTFKLEDPVPFLYEAAERVVDLFR
jgi:predicted ATP-grasp superfamily ATP-dependent carboligase